MTDLEVYGLIIIATALCVVNWRVGVLICVLVGFLQDPLRKLMPGEPVVFSALVGAPVVATLVSAHLRHIRISFRPIYRWNKVLRTPLTLFILVAVVQSVAAVIRTGNPIIGGIGLISYLAPLPAILLGYHFSRAERDLSKFMKFYLILSIIMVSGAYLSYVGLDWKILKQVGEGLFIYSVEKGRLDLYSGFLRTPEIAAWHAAAAICMLVVLSLSVRRTLTLRASAGLLLLILLGALLLTGRRKFLVEIFLFVSIYGLLLIWFRWTAIKSALLSRSAFLLACGLVVGSLGYMYVASDAVNTEISPYYERGVSVRSDATERVSTMTIGSFEYVIAQNGIFGSGAGTGSQGAQHFGGQTTGDAAEGGLGKVLAELGVPGLALLLWLVISVGRYLWSVIQYLAHTPDVDPAVSRLVFGLVAFVVTNGFLYIIAHQVFGDPFVLIILGFLLGFVMATPKIQMLKERRARCEERKAEVRGQRSEIRTDWSPASDI